MPLTVTATCDLCGAVRQACNHWFLGRTAGSPSNRTLVVLSYSEAEARQDGDILCGEGCLHKWVTQRLRDV